MPHPARRETLRDDRHRPHRLGRHGQIDDGEDVRRRLAFPCSTPMPRCIASMRAPRSRRSRRRFPVSLATGTSIARTLGRRVIGDAAGDDAGSKRSSTPWSAPSAKRSWPRPARPVSATARARHSVALRDRRREGRRRRRARLGAQNCAEGPRPGPSGHDRGALRGHTGRSRCRTRKSADKSHHVIETGDGLEAAERQVRALVAELVEQG